MLFNFQVRGLDALQVGAYAKKIVQSDYFGQFYVVEPTEIRAEGRNIERLGIGEWAKMKPDYTLARQGLHWYRHLDDIILGRSDPEKIQLNLKPDEGILTLAGMTDPEEIVVFNRFWLRFDKTMLQGPYSFTATRHYQAQQTPTSMKLLCDIGEHLKDIFCDVDATFTIE